MPFTITREQYETYMARGLERVENATLCSTCRRPLANHLVRAHGGGYETVDMRYLRAGFDLTPGPGPSARNWPGVLCREGDNGEAPASHYDETSAPTARCSCDNCEAAVDMSSVPF